MTPLEQVDLAKRLVSGETSFHDVDWTALPVQEIRDIIALATYEWRRRRGIMERKLQSLDVAQRKAMRLLRTFLSQSQKAELRRRGYFTLVALSGTTYRLKPKTGAADRLEKHGRRYFASVAYCLHDPAREMPPADTTLGHLLLLLSDEAAFLKAANARPGLDQLWNGPYLRRLHAARRARLVDEVLFRTESV